MTMIRLTPANSNKGRSDGITLLSGKMNENAYLLTCRILNISGDKELFLLELKAVLRELGKFSVCFIHTLT